MPRACQQGREEDRQPRRALHVALKQQRREGTLRPHMHDPAAAGTTPARLKPTEGAGLGMWLLTWPNRRSHGDAPASERVDIAAKACEKTSGWQECALFKPLRDGAAEASAVATRSGVNNALLSGVACSTGCSTRAAARGLSFSLESRARTSSHA